MHCKILVVSDSHGDLEHLHRIVLREQPFTALIHCGDGAGDLARIAIPEGVKIVAVAGNVDTGRKHGFGRTAFENICGKKIMVAHGDQFKVVYDLAVLLDEGMCREADLVCFGHTHVPYYHGGTTALFNPGPAERGYYGIILINETFDCSLCRL